MATLTVLGEEVALRHLGQVVLVQELALVALLAEPAQPVLAHDALLARHVSEGALRALEAAARQVVHTDGGTRLCNQSIPSNTALSSTQAGPKPNICHVTAPASCNAQENNSQKTLEPLMHAQTCENEREMSRCKFNVYRHEQIYG